MLTKLHKQNGVERFIHWHQTLSPAAKAATNSCYVEHELINVTVTCMQVLKSQHSISFILSWFYCNPDSSSSPFSHSCLECAILQHVRSVTFNSHLNFNQKYFQSALSVHSFITQLLLWHLIDRVKGVWWYYYFSVQALRFVVCITVVYPKGRINLLLKNVAKRSL